MRRGQAIKFNNLFTLTQQESGFVIYPEEVIICNWCMCLNDELPVLFDDLGMIIPWYGGVSKEVTSIGKVDDIRNLLESKEIIYDLNNEAEIILNSKVAGTMYTITFDNIVVQVIAPEEWC